MHKKIFAFAVLAFVAWRAAGDVQARTSLEARDQAQTALKASRASHFSPPDLRTLAGCTPIPLTPPATVNGFINSSSCYDSVINGYEDIYHLNLIAGQTVTIDYSSTAFDTFLWMNQGPISTRVSYLFQGISRSRIVFTPTTTKAYEMEAETLFGPGDSEPHTGAYTLLITVTGGSVSCTSTTTTMCLNNNRFAVSATYATSSTNGQARAMKLTSDSGYFTFFSESNVEIVIKVLDACGLNSRFWVYAGGLTNVNTVITVRDTKTGTTKTYTNPANTPFQPIQDSSALATCP